MHHIIDDIDQQIISLLQERGRLAQSDLAAAVGLSPAALGERLRKLEARGVIRGYAALVDPAAMGLGALAFVRVQLAGPDYRAAESAFLAHVRASTTILECHHVAGEDSYLLKVRARDNADLSRLLGRLKELPGLARTNTQIVLDTAKETTVLPIAEGAT
jgi:Lrp/AsnC family transcriptional regulator, leucine-responsive regulatory protein